MFTHLDSSLVYRLDHYILGWLKRVMNAPQIRVVTGNHLCHNPRVIKEASALAEYGYDVEVLGAWTDTNLIQRDLDLVTIFPFRFTPVVDLTKKDFASRLDCTSWRVLSKAARLVYCKTGISSGYQLSPWVTLLSSKVIAQSSDLCIAHSEVAMAVVTASLEVGGRIGIDLEDWFSEDLLPEARRLRPVSMLRRLERTLLQRGLHATCPSHAMSQALADEFSCRPPRVVYNAFPWSDRQALEGKTVDRRDRRLPSLHWYSQTIGPGRGLEDLFSALPYLDRPLEIHLRGNPVPKFQEWLDGQIPSGWHKRVFVHPIVTNEQLLSRIAEHDIGFAGEVPYCRSRDLTVTNKILHYLLGGLAVVASDTRGQREVAEQARAVTGAEPVLLYPSGDPLALAARIDQLLATPEYLAQAKAAALTAAERTFCWERQVPVLLDSVQAALAIP